MSTLASPGRSNAIEPISPGKEGDALAASASAATAAPAAAAKTRIGILQTLCPGPTLALRAPKVNASRARSAGQATRARISCWWQLRELPLRRWYRQVDVQREAIDTACFERGGGLCGL